MEFLNKIELVGVVGYATEKTYGGATVGLSLSVMTEYVCLDPDGNSVVTVHWHLVQAHPSVVKDSLDDIEKGTWVKVTGRLEYKKFISSEGEEQRTAIIVAKEIEVLKKN